MYCQNNQLTNLDLSHNNALNNLYCNNNQLTSLDLSHNNALYDLKCNDNKFDCKALKAKYDLQNE